MKLQTVNHRVAVEPFAAEDVSDGGIIIPEQAKETAVDGIVRSVWKPTEKDKAERVFPRVDVGDQVLFPKYSGTDIVVDGVKLRVMLEEDLLGVFSE